MNIKGISHRSLLLSLSLLSLLPLGVKSQNLSPPTVNLGRAGDFVILAKTGISTTGTTAITGNIGVSPAAASFITGFGLLAPPTTYTTSAIVTGEVFAADYDPPTPSNLTTSVLNMQTAYTDAAGRAPNVTELGAGDIGGMTLAPAVYKWGSNLLIPTNVTLSGSATDIWIFQIAGNLTQSSGVSINLAGGALAKNIFWQVAGAASLGTTAHFEGTLLSQTSIVLMTGATANGKLLAQTAVTLDANAVVDAAPATVGISGTVTSGTAPLAGVQVMLISNMVHVDSILTDTAGHYSFARATVGTGVKQVRASKAGYITINTSVIVTGIPATVNFNLAAGGGNLAGKVLKASDSTAVTGAKLVLRRGTTLVDSLLTDSAGNYAFNGLIAANNYTITTTASTFFPSTSNLAVTTNATATFNIYLSLTLPATITGTVRSTVTTNPIANALVVLRRGSAVAVILDSVRTNGSGVYTFTNVAPGTPNAWITASATGFIAATNNSLVVGNGATVTSNFSLTSPGIIKGTLTNVVQGVPLGMNNVLMVLRATSLTTAIIDSTRSNAQGTYSFSNVIPGKYFVTALSTIGTQNSDSIRVNSGATVTFNFTFNQTAIYSVLSSSHPIHFLQSGDRLILDLGMSKVSRTVTAFNLHGSIQHQVSVPAGVSQVILPAIYAPSNGYFFQVH